MTRPQSDRTGGDGLHERAREHLTRWGSYSDLTRADMLVAFAKAELARAAPPQPAPDALREALISECAHRARTYFETISDGKGMLKANAKGFGENIARHIEALSAPAQSGKESDGVGEIEAALLDQCIAFLESWNWRPSSEALAEFVRMHTLTIPPATKREQKQISE